MVENVPGIYNGQGVYNIGGGGGGGGEPIPEGYEILPYCYMEGDVNITGTRTPFKKEDEIYGMCAPTIKNYASDSSLYLYQLDSQGYDFQARINLDPSYWYARLVEGVNQFNGSQENYPLPDIIDFRRTNEPNYFTVNGINAYNSQRVTIDRVVRRLNRSYYQKKIFFYFGVRRAGQDIIKYYPAKRILDNVKGVLEIYTGMFYTGGIS